MESLAIVQVAHSFPPYVGGLSHVVDMLSESLLKLGHQVEVVTLDPSGRLKETERLGGMRVRRFRCFAPSNAYFVPSPKAMRYLRSAEADLVHAHNIGALLAPAAWLATEVETRRRPFVISPHHHASGSLWHTRMFWKPYAPFAGKILRSADAVHCVSEFEARLVRKDFGVESSVVPNGVSDEVFSYRWNPPRDRLVLAYAGRLEKYKRVSALVESASMLSKRGYDARVRIVGGGPDLSNIVRLSGRLGVGVEHYDFLPRAEYLRLLSTSSCLVNPSMYEAFSIVTAEALAIGLPVVASLPWGEIFGGAEGVFLVDGGSAEGLAEAVMEATKFEGRDRSHIPSWDDVARRLVHEVYLPSMAS